MKVLVIEDSVQVVNDIAFCLQVRYPDVDVISTDKGENGIDLIELESPYLVIVDTSLPDISTIDLVKRIREFSDIALIVISSDNDPFERAKELEAGADEYIIKPFSPIEFLAKIRALFRRIGGGVNFSNAGPVNYGKELTVNFTTREVIVSGKHLRLTPIEFQLLSELVRNEGRITPSDTLAEKIWGPDYYDANGTIKKYVHRLRSKIEPDVNNPQMIITERGLGYKFNRF